MRNKEARHNEIKYLYSILLVVTVLICGNTPEWQYKLVCQTTRRCQRPQKRQHCLLSVEPEQQ